MTTWLKVIGPANEACHGGDWDYADYLPTDDGPGPWLPEREPVLCESGWHWCTPESLMQRWAYPDMRVYEVEPSDDVTELDNDGKCVSSSGRLLREHPLPDWWTDAMAYCRDVIPQTPWMQRVTEPDPAWRVFPTWNAARNAARGAARDAARNAAWDAARDAARNAALNAARNAALNAAWNAARDAARDAARNAAWDAVLDAALYVVTHYVCRDLPLDPAHRDHAAKRWEVWQRGYGGVGDIDGVLYVYERVS